MARPAKLDPKKALSEATAEVVRLFPPAEICQAAETSGFVERDRKVDPILFFWNLVLGFSCSAQRTLAALRRQYQTISDVELAPSSFYDRFSPQLVAFLKLLLQEALGRFSFSTLTGKLGALFKDVKIFDNTVIALADALAKIFPGTASKAAVKVCVVLSVACQSARSISIHSGKTAEIKTIRLGPWVKDNLLLFDLGFFKYGFFARITENGGHFISRLREDANPRIVVVHRQWRGRSIELVGKTLKEIRGSLKRQEIDVEVEVSFRRREYGKATGKPDTMRLRLVGLRDEAEDEYHFFLTDIPPEALTVEEIGQLYRGRWFVELLFKELKSRYALDVIITSNPIVVEALIYTALLTLTVSRAMFLAYKAHFRRAHGSITPMRWATMFYEQVPYIRIRILRASGREATPESLLEAALMEAEDPTPARIRLEKVFSL